MSQAIQKRIAYIGAGQMCEAIFSGLISSGAILPEHILLYDVNESRLTDLQSRYRTNILTPSAHAYEDLVSWADIVPPLRIGSITTRRIESVLYRYHI